MNREEFLTKLERYLRYLPKKEKTLELNKFRNQEVINLDPVETANKIYEEKGLKTRVLKEIKLFDAINIIIKNLQLKEQKVITNLLLFFLYLLFLIVLIKMPFIYIRDIISNLFNIFLSTDAKLIIWNLIFEVLYAIFCILILIRVIKKKAIQLEKNVK